MHFDTGLGILMLLVLAGCGYLFWRDQHELLNRVRDRVASLHHKIKRVTPLTKGIAGLNQYYDNPAPAWERRRRFFTVIIENDSGSTEKQIWIANGSDIHRAD